MRYIYEDISHFYINLSKRGYMTQVHCDRKHCLNNDKYGICTADAIEYNGLCQTYITANIHVNHIVGYVARIKAS